MSDQSQDVRYEVRGGVAWLTIEREAHRNSLRAETLEGLMDGLCQAAGDESVRLLCVTGAGEKAFCAGADLGAASSGKDLGLERYVELLRTIAELKKPIVARVAGHCVGGGMGLMLACDVVYAADDVKIGTPEVNVGLFPMMVAALLPRDASRKKVMEMVFTGELVSAVDSEKMGLITRAVPRDSLDAAVEKLLSTIASKAPLALTFGRQALVATEEMPLPAALDYLCGRLEALMKTEDAAEGVRAFKEKRTPEWKGR